MLEESDYDYKAIIERLRISNRRLILMEKGEQKLADYGGILKKEEGGKIPQIKCKPRQ